MSLVRFNTHSSGDPFDLLPVVEKEKLLLVEEDPDVTTRELLLDTRQLSAKHDTPLVLHITHQILVPMTLRVAIRVYVHGKHQVRMYYKQQIMANKVASTVVVKGVVRDHGWLQLDSLLQPEGKREGLQLRTTKQFIVTEQGQAWSKPELAALHQGMRASHGLTMSGLDPRQLYFVQARGLNRADSQELLLSI